MLIRAFIKNFLSFDEETVLNLYPGKGPEQKHIVKGEKRDDIPALKTAVVYGANASGKSNLVKAIAFIKFMVTKGFSAQKGIPYEPFKLSDSFHKPSKIEFEIKINDTCYAYGFDFNKKEILEEWLVKLNKRTEQTVFNRKTHQDEVKVKFDKVKFDNKDNEMFAHFTGRGTPRNRLFLLEAQRRNLNFIDEINEVYGWFHRKLNVVFPDSRIEGLEFNLSEDKSLATAFTRFLTYFKTGITELSPKKMDPESDLDELPEDLLHNILGELE